MEQNQLSDDLKFMRSIIERTQRQIDPAAPIMITWGFICLFGYLATHWLAVEQLFRYIWWLWLIVCWPVGFILSIFFGYRVRKREIRRGVRSYVSKQIGWVWAILVPNGIIWTLLGILRDPFGAPGFLWASIYGIGLSMMGILYSREWLIAGIGIFVAIIVATFAKPYAYIILGVVMGLGCIIPGLMAQQRVRRWENEDVQV